MLARYVRDRNFERIAHGIYLGNDAWPDEMYILGLRCPQVIFSHESALYLYDLTDREPSKPTVTAKSGYNPSRLKLCGVKVYTVKAELHEQGRSSAVTVFGHTVAVYDMERTLCDVARSRRDIESQIFTDALKLYARKKGKNLSRLMEYAGKLHVENILRPYLDVLL